MSKPGVQDFSAYVAEKVKDWPPLSEWQIVKLRHIYNPTQNRHPGPPPISEAELAEKREQKAIVDRNRRVREYAASLLLCEGCGWGPEAHGPDTRHEWTPLRQVLEMLDEQTGD